MAGIGGVTSALVHLALDVSVIQQRVLASNIANANSRSYRPMEFDIAKLMAPLRRHGVLEDDRRLTAEIEKAGQAEQMQDLIVPAHERVEVDMELAKMVQNTLHYQALLAASSKRSEVIKMAILEGRL